MSDQQFGEGKEPGEQGSLEWLMSRVGMITASRFNDVLDKQKSGKPGAKRQNYLMEIVVERLTGKPVEHYLNAAMEWGSEQESMARMAYEAATGAMVDEVGFIHHATLKDVGGSPDGFCGEDGGFEAKCPFNTANHVYTLLDGMPEEHMAQVQGLMWVTGRKWWDFVSYDPRLPEPLDMHRQRIERDDKYIEAMEAEIIAFIAEVNTMVAKLQAIGKEPSAAIDAATPVSSPLAGPVDVAASGPLGAA